MGAPEGAPDGPMNDAPERRPAPGGSDGTAGDDGFERLMAAPREPTPEVTAAKAEMEAARAEMAAALDDLSDAARSAVDLPAKVRRNPVKTVALAGGAGFLLVGGPRKVLRYAVRSVRPPKPPRSRGLLPEEIEKILKDSKVAHDPEVRKAIEDDFAEYLRRKGKHTPEPSATTSFWRTFDRVAGPLGTAGARVLVTRLMEAERTRGEARKDARERRRGQRVKAEDGRPSRGS